MSPRVWTATATYSKTTYTTREVADGYRATAVYRGEVGKTRHRERGLHRDLYGQ